MQLRALAQVRTLLLGAVLAALVIPLTAYGANAIKSSTNDATIQREAELYQIDQVERTFHKAGSTHNVNLMMSLLAPGATFNIGTKTYIGKTRSEGSSRLRTPPSSPRTTGNRTHRRTRSG